MVTTVIFYQDVCMTMGFPGGSDCKESACSAGDRVWIAGSGRSPGEGNGNPLQYFCLENSMDRGAWWATIHRVTKSQSREFSISGEVNTDNSN